MDLEKYQRLFVEEARENLRVFHQSLSALEQRNANLDAAPTAEAVIHELFRAAHSMKGMAASLGHTQFAEVAHGLEELADQGRQGETIPPQDIELLVTGGDLLARLLEQIQDGEGADEAACVTVLGQIRSRLAAAAHPAKPTLDTELESPAEVGLAMPTGAMAPQAGEVALQVWLETGISMPKARAFLVHRQVSQLEQFLRADPTPETWSEAHERRGTLWFIFSAEGLQRTAIAVAVEKATGVERVMWHEAAFEQKTTTVSAAAPSLAPAQETSSSARETKTKNDKIWQRTVRVRASLLDGFMDSVSELLLTRAKLRAVASHSNETNLLELVDEIERQIRDLHARVVAARMTPLHFLTDGFPRSVRDMARQTGKDVRLTIEGADIEVDRAILDELHAPMIHLLRNAIDHGHEGNLERRACNKSEQMTIRLRAQREDEHLVLLFEDDGAGIDEKMVTQRALKKGLLTQEQLGDLKAHQVLDLICTPGFSTKLEVTDLSGRGVGMDVVKQGVERLGGKLEIASNVGEGTRMQLRLPLTVSLMQVLLVEAQMTRPNPSSSGTSPIEDLAGSTPSTVFLARASTSPVFAVSAQRILRILALPDDSSEESNGSVQLWVDGIAVPLYDLAGALGYPVCAAKGGVALVVEHGTEMIAFRAARVVGQEEVVAKSLAFPLSRISYLAGAALLADGRAAFILEPGRLPLHGGVVVGTETAPVSAELVLN